MKLKIFVAIFGILVFACSRKIQPLPSEQRPGSLPAADTIPIAKTETLKLPPADSVPIVTSPTDTPSRVIVGAERLSEYLPWIEGKQVALVVNHTSLIHNVHLADTLRSLGVRIKAIFAPEHGFRGTAADGEKIADGKDPRTGIPVISLYGNKRAPSMQDLAGVDWVIFDIQDVGARFYTYISTMTYVMQSCAESKVKMLVLDRPNPNGHYVDGPLLESAFKSFVGLHPVPVVYGMTIGEYALMVNGEGWLDGGTKCDLHVVRCAHYDHNTPYELPVKPSPNLPNMRAIYLYPSLCFFEGTNVSVGRGTSKQFQVLGSPGFPKGDFTFTPQPMEGATQPPLQGKLCRGYDLTHLPPDTIRLERKINLAYLLDFYHHFPDKASFFLKTNYIDKLAGNQSLRAQIIANRTEAEIRATWQPGLSDFLKIRKKYLLYPDFE